MGRFVLKVLSDLLHSFISLVQEKNGLTIRVKPCRKSSILEMVTFCFDTTPTQSTK